jgi:predicted RNA binding protein YcfA (HicA-like mRNA interferase family)
VVPAHSGEIIGPGLMAKILHDYDMGREEFQGLL